MEIDARPIGPTATIIAEDYLTRVKAVARSKLTTTKSTLPTWKASTTTAMGSPGDLMITIDSPIQEVPVKFAKSFCPASSCLRHRADSSHVF